jgi:hypothetical protein
MSKLTGFVWAPGRPASPRRTISVFLSLLLWSTLTGELYASEQFGKVEYLPPKVEGQKHGADPIISVLDSLRVRC